MSATATGDNPCLRAALWYASRGIPVFPCRPRTKLPLTKHGCKNATTNPDIIRDWWKRWPDANVAGATGDIVAVDVDEKNGVSGSLALQRIETEHGPLPQCPTQLTPTGGRHLLFSDPHHRLKNSAGSRLGPGLDTRALGGYILLAPSVHPNGGIYRWAEGRHLRAIAPPPVPEWIAKLFDKPEPQPLKANGHDLTRVSAYAEVALLNECAAVSRASKGGRNHQLNISAFALGQLVGADMLDEQRAAAALYNAAIACALVGEDGQQKTEGTIKSGLTAGKARPREILARGGDRPVEHSPRSESAGEVPWPDPDLSVLKQGRREPPPFPTKIFGSFWETWLGSVAEGANSPVDYPGGALLASAAALIGNARRVSPWQSWQEPCVLWISEVGDPSSNKSPGQDPLRDICKTLEHEMTPAFDTALQKWRVEQEMAKALYEEWKLRVKDAAKQGGSAPPIPDGAEMPKMPVQPRIIVNDTTPEKLGELLAAHQKGLLFSRDELAGWFGSFDRYGGSGAERALWIEAFGGRKYTIDRVKLEKPIIIPYLSISILGGIQPDRLVEMMKGPDDGLNSRFLWLWPDPVKPSRPVGAADMLAATTGLRRLLALKMASEDSGRVVPVVLPLTEEAASLFHDWRLEHDQESHSLSGVMASAWGKAQGQLLRLALVFEHLWWCADPNSGPAPQEVSATAMKSAAGMIEDYFKPMAGRVYGDAALPERDRLGALVARWIAEKHPKIINVREISRTAGLPGLKEAEKVKLALGLLVETDWLRAAPLRAGDTKGRHREDYVLNPKIARGGHA